MSNSSDSLMINTPASIRQCEVVNILWSGGVEPYYVGYIAAGTVGLSSDQPSPAVAFKTSQNSRNWTCNVAGGVAISLTVRDSSGQSAYSSPIQVQDTGNETCLPGYTSPKSTSSGISKGAIGGIVGGVIGGLLILLLFAALVWRRKKRRRAAASTFSRSEKEGFEEVGEPKVEPYVGRGGVDLGEEGASPRTSQVTTRDSPVGELERETKQMLGVGSPTSAHTNGNPSSSSRAVGSPLPTKSMGSALAPTASSPTTAPGNATAQNPQSPPDTSEEASDISSPVSREQEVEYVRHTDGGVMQVELPPLYSDVPRRE